MLGSLSKLFRLPGIDFSKTIVCAGAKLKDVICDSYATYCKILVTVSLDPDYVRRNAGPGLDADDFVKETFVEKITIIILEKKQMTKYINTYHAKDYNYI